MLNKEKLEQLLLANWTDVLDKKQLFQFISNHSGINDTYKIHKMTLSRFEIVEEGFILWLEYSLLLTDKTLQITNEIHLSNTGVATNKGSFIF